MPERLSEEEIEQLVLRLHEVEVCPSAAIPPRCLLARLWPLSRAGSRWRRARSAADDSQTIDSDI